MIGSAKKTAIPPETGTLVLSRAEAIGRLRACLRKYTDEETSICKAAADRGMFCKGFTRYTDDELRRRYSWIVEKRPEMTRAELEQVANDWQLAQQEVYELPIACDVQQKVRDTCRGWNDFTDDQLARFFFQMTGQQISIA